MTDAGPRLLPRAEPPAHAGLLPLRVTLAAGVETALLMVVLGGGRSEAPRLTVPLSVLILTTFANVGSSSMAASSALVFRDPGIAGAAIPGTLPTELSELFSAAKVIGEERLELAP